MGLFGSALVKMPHCRKSHVMAHIQLCCFRGLFDKKCEPLSVLLKEQSDLGQQFL